MSIHKSYAAQAIAGPERHIAFPINCEGWGSSCELTSGIISTYWPCLAMPKRRELGDTVSKEVGGKVFHALVVECPIFGWESAPRHITACLNKLEVPEPEEIATVLMGAEMVSDPPRPCDPNLSRILAAIESASPQMVVYGKLPVQVAQAV